MVIDEIVSHESVAPGVFRLSFYEPRIASHAKTGQFVIVIPLETGERIPLTINRADPKTNIITLVYQVVGKTTVLLSTLQPGQKLHAVLGPLGKPSHIEKLDKTVVLVSGGLGAAIILPEMYAFRAVGTLVVSVIGARTEDLLLFRDEFERHSDRVLIATNDGSCGVKGFVTDALETYLQEHASEVAFVKAIGPNRMMEAVTKIAAKYNLPTYVSLTSIMVDGTGMCGSCRVSIHGKIYHVCVDGPEFLAEGIDFTELENRNKRFQEMEKKAYETWCQCQPERR
ncbi:sulfide/dihydroorotate dehydrogenase-like FAD/NAD-binding protein [Thermospira aquatica]|uniref:Sulfide/dihydroorotate dehydrogenase-like FAD/NAD-binding protein n=1 Tax=Thermospira aquatica TaxID=2828656 RepID=A0AAX3BEW9_9SPIR|nr:sulfide/dihydroorotate dehydrogenase-like FAD/NAD-binding protein [Thermospira aquatica]URA10751.1 sulfide/dihydroorotate dehydrogenase-like FAD/NAD-binding protein [Thermospira aquatica]